MKCDNKATLVSNLQLLCLGRINSTTGREKNIRSQELPASSMYSTQQLSHARKRPLLHQLRLAQYLPVDPWQSGYAAPSESVVHLATGVCHRSTPSLQKRGGACSSTRPSWMTSVKIAKLCKSQVPLLSPKSSNPLQLSLACWTLVKPSPRRSAKMSSQWNEKASSPTSRTTFLRLSGLSGGDPKAMFSKACKPSSRAPDNIGRAVLPLPFKDLRRLGLRFGVATHSETQS